LFFRVLRVVKKEAGEEDSAMSCLPSVPLSAASHAERPDGVTRDGEIVGCWTCTMLSDAK
jgi:hypothetical protein